MKPPLPLISLALCLLALTVGCGTSRELIFVTETVDVKGNPEVVLKLTEPMSAKVAYYNGSSWVEADEAEVPAGWLVVSPRVLEGDK